VVVSSTRLYVSPLCSMSSVKRCMPIGLQCGDVCVSRYSYLQRSLTVACVTVELHGLEDGSVEATFEVPAVPFRGMEMS
jgi:hypothetical protein